MRRGPGSSPVQNIQLITYRNKFTLRASVTSLVLHFLKFVMSPYKFALFCHSAHTQGKGK